MSEPNFERLSAAYDREATPAERAEVDRWLAESSVADEVWDDFGQISQRLLDLPTESLPVDFTASVLSRISSPSPAPAPAKRVISPRRWLFTAGAFVGAAVLLVVIRFAGLDSQEVKVAEGKRAGDRPMGSAPAPLAADSPLRMAADSAPLEERNKPQVFPAAPAGSGPVASPEVRMASARPETPGPTPAPTLVAPAPIVAPAPLPQEEGHGPVPGEVIVQRVEQGGVVKVMRIYVIEPGRLEKFQEVLTRNQILQDAQPSGRQAVDRPVLLVVASKEQMTTALQQSVDGNVVENYVEGEPLKIALLPQDWQVALGAEVTPRSTTPAPAVAVAPSATAPFPAEKKSRRDGVAMNRENSRRSTQTSVGLPAPMEPLFDESTKPGAGQAPPVRRAEPPAVGRAASKTPAKAKSDSPVSAPAADMSPADRWVILVQVAPSKNLKARESTPRKAGDG